MKSLIIPKLILVAILVAGCSKKQTTQSAVESSTKTNVVRISPRTNYYGIFTENDFTSMIRKEVDISEVVAYGSVDTNTFPNFVVTISEIWKGTSAALTLGITNGTHFTARWSALSDASMPGGHFPDGAIVLIKKAEIPSDSTETRAVYYVWKGHIFNMTIQKYKDTVGL